MNMMYHQFFELQLHSQYFLVRKTKVTNQLMAIRGFGLAIRYHLWTWTCVQMLTWRSPLAKYWVKLEPWTGWGQYMPWMRTICSFKKMIKHPKNSDIGNPCVLFIVFHLRLWLLREGGIVLYFTRALVNLSNGFPRRTQGLKERRWKEPTLLIYLTWHIFGIVPYTPSPFKLGVFLNVTH